MSPDRLMYMGASIGLPFAILDAIWDGPSLAVLTLFAGMTFGKGYGVFEERERHGPR